MTDVQPALLPDDPTADDVQETVPGLSSWEFINAVPTAEDVMALLKTVRPVYGIKAEDFADFVQALPSSKKRPGAGRNEERLQVYTLYMSVAGRMAMLNAAQEKHGWRVDHEPEPVTPTGIPGYLRFDNENTLGVDEDGSPVGGRIVYREYISISTWAAQAEWVPIGRKPGTAWVPAQGGSNAVGSNRFEKCLAPGTRVLTTDLRWVPIETVCVGDELIGFDEQIGGRGHGSGQNLRRALVTGRAVLRRPSYRIITDRAEITASTDHRWLRRHRRDERSHKGEGERSWWPTERLTAGMTIAAYADPWETDETRDGGYLAGFLDGEGTIGNGLLRWTQLDGDVSDTVARLVKERGFVVGSCPEVGAHRNDLTRWYIRGAQGETLRALGTLRPTRLLARASDCWEGWRTWSRTGPLAQRVESVEFIGDHDVIALETDTGTFIAEGLLSHNCETSARGRAVAAWGFGVLPGSGIASLEEMQGATENAAGQTRAPRERGRGQRTETRRPRAELITEVLTRAEQVRQLRGSSEEEMTTRLAEYVKKTFGIDIAAEGYSDDEGKAVVVTVEWDKVKDGQLQLCANQLLDTLTKLEAERSAV